MAQPFVSRVPTAEEYWRAIILYGRNSATYKFALAYALLELKPQSGAIVRLEEIAPLFGKAVAAHIKDAPKQGTNRSSKFLDACRKFNHDKNESHLINETIKNGFQHVIDAFHNVASEKSGDIEKPFFVDNRKINRAICITDEFSKILESDQSSNFIPEVDSRWRLVETAWNLGIPKSAIGIKYDEGSCVFYADFVGVRRKSITGARAALNGYQKGQCFYCRTSISVENPVTAEVDHFFPHVLKERGFQPNLIDGVWNLVLSCGVCNGASEKWASVPSIALLERLSTRNEYLIESQHPLRELLMLQTGASESERRVFLNNMHGNARAVLIHVWSPKDEAKEDVGRKEKTSFQERQKEGDSSKEPPTGYSQGVLF